MDQVVVTGNTRLKDLYGRIVGVAINREHFTVNRKYAVGILREREEILVYNYSIAEMPIAVVRGAGEEVLLRLGTKVGHLVKILDALFPIMQTLVLRHGRQQPSVIPQLLPPPIPADDIRSTLGLNKDGQVVLQQLARSSGSNTRVFGGVVS